MMDEPKTVEDLDPIMLEYPFIYAGMTIEKYNEEKLYLAHHWQEYRNTVIQERRV